MSALERIADQARLSPGRIVLPEATDSRVIRAAIESREKGVGEPILIGNADQIAALAKAHGCNVKGIEIVDPNLDLNIDKYGGELYRRRKHKGLTADQAREMITDPLVLAALMVGTGVAQGCVAGATHTTAEVVRAGLHYVGISPGNDLVSSFFIMDHQQSHQAIKGTALYADCALVIDPDAAQLAAIAIATADSARNLLQIEPVVALLSFSTAGSADHPHVEKVRQAGSLVTRQRPDIGLMTEVQFDSAVDSEILKRKAPDLAGRGPANVFVFPELQSANIGYKIAQRIGGVTATGPVLQGLKAPVNDLSRGCSVQDITQLIAVTSVQATGTSEISP